MTMKIRPSGSLTIPSFATRTLAHFILAGPQFLFDTATADADPGAGKLRADDTLDAASFLYVDNKERAGANISAWLDTFDDTGAAGNHGQIALVLASNQQVIAYLTVTGTVVDGSGYRKIPINYVAPASVPDFANEYVVLVRLSGGPGAAGASGASRFVNVRVVDTQEGDPSTDYEAGDTVDGVSLAQNDLVLRATDGGDAADGIYVASASGAAARHTDFDADDDLPGVYVGVMEGDDYADTLWRCISDLGMTIDTDPAVFELASAAEPITDVFTSSGTWTKRAGARRVKAIIVGPGGAGGGPLATGSGEQSAGAGGGGGETVSKWFDADDLGATEDVDIGTGGVPASGAIGGSGTSTSFGLHISADFGTGGDVAPSAAVTDGALGGIGGGGSSGDVVLGGQGGSSGIQINDNSRGIGGQGGSSVYGGGGRGTRSNASGQTGHDYGGGGSGGANGQNQSARSGGAGADGLAIVETHFK